MNGLDSLVYREPVNPHMAMEHEYLLFRAPSYGKNDPATVDVFNFEGGMELHHDTDVGILDLLEAVEAWYPRYRGTDTVINTPEYYGKGSLGDIIGEENDIFSVELYFYDHEMDPFEVKWEDYSDHSESGDPTPFKVSMTFYYDDNDLEDDLRIPEPLERIFPRIVRRDAPEDSKYLLLSDMVTYINTEPGTESYQAPDGMDLEEMKKMFKDRTPDTPTL